MPVFHLTDVPGTHFPAGRLTRVLAGPGAPVEPDHFVMGYVTIYPGGEVPGHAHSQEEVYFIISGRGTIELGGGETPVEAGTYALIRPGQEHCLRNTGKEDLTMLFCYAPKGIVDHWREELESAEGEP
jgi:mannose-6-phosphate isomerase-like protein (cupin superfamily)